MVRVLALVADPIYDGVRIHERFGWTDPFGGVKQAEADLNLGLSGSGFSYQITTEEVPLPPFGARNPDSTRTGIDEVNTSAPIFLSPAEWARQWLLLGWQPNLWPGQGNLHLKWFIENHIRPRVQDFDEFWLAGLPMPAAFEGGMLAPEWDLAAPRVGTWDRPLAPFSVAPAVTCTMGLPKGLEQPISLDWLKSYRTHDTLVNVPGISKRYIWHMFQVSNFNPIHNYCHRTEAILHHIWGSGWNGYQEQWDGPVAPSNLRSYNDLFGNTDNTYPGLGFAGSCHFLVNAKGGYWYDMDDVVPSGAHLFKDFPNGFPVNLDTIQQKMKLVSRKDWEGLHDPLIWWLQQLPRNPGKADSRWCNWLKYVTDVNDETGMGMPTTPPTVGQRPPLPGVFTRYGDRVLIRWQPRTGDGGDQLYSLATDGTTEKTLKRRGENHLKLSLDVRLARSYTIRGDHPNVWEQPWTEGVPTPEGEALMNHDELKALILDVHQKELVGCPAPSTFTPDANRVYLFVAWPGKPHIPMHGFFDAAMTRQNYITMFNNRADLKALCGGVTPPPPAAITLEAVKERILRLYAPGGRYAGCVPPDRWAEDAFAYRAHWNFEGNNLMIPKPISSLDVAEAQYVQSYGIMPGRDALCQQTPAPGPTPTPTPSLKDIARVKVAALRAELAVWEKEL